MSIAFKEKLDRKNTDVFGLAKYLKLDGIDLDDIDVDGSINFFLNPQYRSYGLDSIEVDIVLVSATITWSVDSEYQSAEDIARLTAAGGTLSRNGNIEGQVQIGVAADTIGWNIDAKNVECKPSGQMTITNVEFDLGGTTNFISVS